MKTQSHNSTESGLAAGLKIMTLAVVLGFVAMVSAPVFVPGSVQESSAASTPAVTQSSDYFPSHYAAPTVVSEQPPTF